jgi:hypothetical protein
MLISVLLLASILTAVPSAHAQSDPCAGTPSGERCRVLDDFASYAPGARPTQWYANRGWDRIIPLTADGVMDDRQYVRVRAAEGNQFARAHTEGEAIRILRAAPRGFAWDTEALPYLQWRWRAQQLPEGANERNSATNDTGAAIYVTFGRDWLGRPKSIKYTYSSSLPVGTTVSYGPLKVLVVASAAEQGTGSWVRHTRNVVADYKRLFGSAPDKAPQAISLWSDSDTMNGTATVDFDDIVLRSSGSPSPNP